MEDSSPDRPQILRLPHSLTEEGWHGLSPLVWTTCRPTGPPAPDGPQCLPLAGASLVQADDAADLEPDGRHLVLAGIVSTPVPGRPWPSRAVPR